MANILRPTYDPRQDSGTSGAEVSDLRPEQAYDTDLRRLDEDKRAAAESVNRKQNRVAKFFKAARTAGRYRQRAGIAEPTIDGETPRSRLEINGVELPSLGDSGGRAGGMSYARKPSIQFGKPFG